ncbi:PP2C family serine/threonine-protein phosphatase [Pseudacidovorax sp. RU35E]|uniref:PP2C family protein-serine/threonine phosphatase n=1 Tax=Pseudacidovorax sp. RU35E TaxID=1907403 RepID=UPI0009562372|nr:PP2C family serine/threonine-protein phosphatase [Pseudacidovorax sp. RU35E]SIQ83044.1 Serine/threonine protein phosphatase PrpC [Pseudacidovorax sp. RU35E]
MKFSVFQVSRKGGRLKNEDRMGYCYTRESALFVLADGMGGHPEGEVAAQIALQAVAAMFQRDARPVLKDVRAFLVAAVMAAHQQIMRYAGGKAMLDTPRTTIVVGVLQQGCATWIHCGDSRLYVVRDHRLLVRTRDHSNAERPRATDGVDAPVNRNILQTCLGSPVPPLFDLSEPLPLQQGDRLMLCSDGLWGVVEDALLVRTLSARPVADAAPELVEMALRRGGSHSDNVTLIAVEWETPDAPGSEPGVSTDSIGPDVFASSIQAGMPGEEDHDELDEAAIERSIAEINEAIRRSAARKN